MSKRFARFRLRIVALLTTLILLLIATLIVPQSASAHFVASHCRLPHPTLPRSVTVKHHRATLHQRQTLTRILNVGKSMRANRRVNISAIAATTQESSAENLSYGHGSSVGPFQLISAHGTYRWRMVVENQARWYYRAAIQINRQRPYLNAAQLAQAVERSGHPDAYRQWLSEARVTYGIYVHTCK